MRRVAALLAAEIHGAIARVLRVVIVRSIRRPQSPLILLRIERDLDRQKALVAGVRAHERPVGADVATHQARGHRLLDRRVEQLLQDSGLVEPAAVLTERGRVPRVLVEIEPDKLPFAVHAKQITAHERPRKSCSGGIDGRPIGA